MNDFEEKLRRARLRPPSDALDDRVLSQIPTETVPARLPERRIPLWAALAASILMALAGYAAGVLLPLRRADLSAPSAASSSLQVHIIYDSPASNPFDCTRAANDFLPAPLEVKVKTNGGV